MTLDKHQQINSLLVHNPGTVIAVEGQLYEVPVDEDKIYLLVNLPPHFPDDPPLVTLSPSGMRHPWVDNDVIIHEGINAWTPLHSNLGLLVKDIREEFVQRPPAKKTAQTEESYNYKPPPPIPTTPTNPEYIAVSKLSVEDLEEMLSNETAFEIFFHSLDRVKNLKAFQEDLRNGNETLAHKNLSREDQLIKLRTEIQGLDSDYNLLKLEFEEKERQQQEAFNRFSVATVLTRLKASVYESDELSESVAQSFLDGNLDHDTFVKQFREFRKVYHLRASKLERAQKDNDLLVPSYY
ncbi:hypothetical protein BDB01DRAFT_789614 [Pilobolus umbonatus]|nr:hypothetical protein BDB01DRAFT_789614 [Pilobolus umbonatus]